MGVFTLSVIGGDNAVSDSITYNDTKDQAKAIVTTYSQIYRDGSSCQRVP